MHLLQSNVDLKMIRSWLGHASIETTNRQLVVQGGPGSGKTWLALEQAFRYANGGLRVLLLCYNIALADQLSALVAKRKFETGEVIVRSWAGLARELLDAAGLGWDEPSGPIESEH